MKAKSQPLNGQCDQFSSLVEGFSRHGEQHLGCTKACLCYPDFPLQLQTQIAGPSSYKQKMTLCSHIEVKLYFLENKAKQYSDKCKISENFTASVVCNP